MVQFIRTISNPLTIIAIFAALAEISGTVVLPFVAPENQATFMWFVMGFPVLLVVLFFATLNWNRAALYAPSDFRDEANYMNALKGRVVASELEAVSQHVERLKASLDDTAKTATEKVTAATEELQALKERMNEAQSSVGQISMNGVSLKEVEEHIIGVLLNEPRSVQSIIQSFEGNASPAVTREILEYMVKDGTLIKTDVGRDTYYRLRPTSANALFRAATSDPNFHLPSMRNRRGASPTPVDGHRDQRDS